MSAGRRDLPSDFQERSSKDTSAGRGRQAPTTRFVFLVRVLNLICGTSFHQSYTKKESPLSLRFCFGDDGTSPPPAPVPVRPANPPRPTARDAGPTGVALLPPPRCRPGPPPRQRRHPAMSQGGRGPIGTYAAGPERHRSSTPPRAPADHPPANGLRAGRLHREDKMIGPLSHRQDRTIRGLLVEPRGGRHEGGLGIRLGR